MATGRPLYTATTGTGQPTTSATRISVILPIWGSGYDKYLEECINSIEDQTHKNWEIIIVDTETDLPTARNRGIEKATGDWILCLDADDKIAPDYMEKTLGVDDIVSVGQQKFGDENGLWIPKLHPTLDDFHYANQIHCCSLFKKEIWKTVEGFDESMKIGLEDWMFFAQAAKAGYTFTTIQEPLFFYRRHGITMVKKDKDKHRDLQRYILSKL